ncbi:class I SAM-dependent methyltransferase [Mycobacterium sp.]|uniref:class I SAM-dependent methyltransferase n=1 Tax=Mycobacterium sp. TaxID=1785 RepID=UPI003A86DA68
MTGADRRRWDQRYTRLGPPGADAIGPPEFLAPYADLIPAAGHALDIACGQGRAAVWLASRGLHVWGVDVSPVAIDQARNLARCSGFATQCRFDAVDLDAGLPPGPLVEVILCHKFRDRRLDPTLAARLAPGGLLAIANLGEAGAGVSRFRAHAGELVSRFGELDAVAAGEADGTAWLLARG